MVQYISEESYRTLAPYEYVSGGIDVPSAPLPSVRRYCTITVLYEYSLVSRPPHSVGTCATTSVAHLYCTEFILRIKLLRRYLRNSILTLDTSVPPLPPRWYSTVPRVSKIIQDTYIFEGPEHKKAKRSLLRDEDLHQHRNNCSPFVQCLSSFRQCRRFPVTSTNVSR